MKLIASYLRPYYLRMAGGLAVKILGTAAELLMPWILAHILDDMIPVAKETGGLSPVLWWGAVMLVLAFLARVFNVFANRRAAEVAKNTTGRLRYDLFRSILCLSGRQTDRFGIPSLVSRLTSDSYNIHSAINVLQRMGVRAPIIIAGGMVLTASLEPVLTLVLAATLPFIVGIVWFVSKTGIPLYDRVQQAVDGMVRTLREDVAGIRVIKALSRTEYEKSRFAGANEETVRRELKASGVMAISSPLLNLCLNLGLTAVIVVGAYRVDAGVSQPGKIVAFLTYFTMILNAVISINRIFVVYSKAAASAKRIGLVLSAGEELPLLVDARTGGGGESGASPDLSADGGAGIAVLPKIEFRNVSFAYEGGSDKYCVKNISFRVMPGESLGIIGATGSGKTTLLRLLMRFYDVSEGEILIDGKDIRSYPLKELRGRFGTAFQNDIVFSDTISENIDFGRGLSMEQIETAAKRAKAREFILEKEGGFDHRAAIRGADFSGGQKQRLLVARALAGKPEILLLDDASSALDYKTDAFIRRQIREHGEGMTTITVAQRVSSVMQADQILVLDEGEIIGAGSHKDLAERCEVYREIAQSQLSAVGV